ncbi:MAG: DUF1801 domain-containing protein [Flavobacteriales bacterium]
MMNEIELFFERQPEPNKSTYLSLRDYILSLSDNMTCEWKYGLPYFYFKGKMFCYFWKDKITQEPYIGVARGKLIEHQILESGNRKLVKIIRIDPEKDFPINEMNEVFEALMKTY